MRIMTFNIQHCHDWKNNKIDIDLFADTVIRFGADVCGLNEVRGKGILPDYTDQTNRIADRIGCDRYFGMAVKIMGTSPYGNAVMSRYPIKSARTVKIPDIDELGNPAVYETRGIIVAVMDVDGTDITFLITHMGLTEVQQKNAVATLCPIIKEIDTPLILMGDFNTDPKSEVLKPIYELMQDTDTVSKTPGAFTYASYNPEKKIDYIFYRGLKCTYAETVTEIISDHFPIIAEFEFAVDDS